MSSNSNYKFTSTTRELLLDYAQGMLDRNVYLQASGCPLDYNDVVRALTTEEDRAALAHLRAQGYYVPDNNQVSVRIYGEGGIERGANFTLRSPTRRLPYYQKNNTVLNLDAVNPEKYDAFITWVNRAVTAKRRAEAAKKVVMTFVREFSGDSLAAMRRRWPEFMAVPLSMDPPWPQRVRELTKIKLKMYEWPDDGLACDWYFKNMRNLQLAGTMLAGAQLLTVVADHSEITATVVDWDKTTPA